MPSECATRIIVIIPTYNERQNIARLIPQVMETDTRLHVLVVDDASEDGTAGEVLNYQQKNWPQRLHLYSRQKKLGLGSAYVDGFNWGLSKKYDFLIQMDGDLSHNPTYLAAMLQCAGQADFVVGSRYVTGGGTRNWGMGRRYLSRFGSFYARKALQVRFSDFTGGFNGWTSNVLRKIGLNEIRSNGYSFQIELKYRAYKMGFKHVEFPIVFVDRKTGKSKMSTAIALEAMWRVWQLRFFMRALLQNPSNRNRSIVDCLSK